jgi:hypothetical protein
MISSRTASQRYLGQNQAESRLRGRTSSCTTTSDPIVRRNLRIHAGSGGFCASRGGSIGPDSAGIPQEIRSRCSRSTSDTTPSARAPANPADASTVSALDAAIEAQRCGLGGGHQCAQLLTSFAPAPISSCELGKGGLRGWGRRICVIEHSHLAEQLHALVHPVSHAAHGEARKEE